jgi:hypothetical protein
MFVVPSIAFAVFFVCCIAQFPLGRSFRSKLAERRPDVWAEISKTSWFLDSAVLKFAGSQKCKDLADPELSRAADRIKWLSRIAIGSWLVLAASLFFGHPG